MSIGLSTRKELARAFYALTGSSANDGALKEHDAVAGDQLYYYLSQGAVDAQRYMLTHGWSGFWIKQSPALVWTQGVAEQSAPLPDDFLMLANGGTESALWLANGDSYGSVFDESAHAPDTGVSRSVFGFRLRGERIFVGVGTLPALTLTYHYRHPEFASDAVAVDFPVDHRPLIVSEAAMRASADSWLPGGPEMEARIDRAVSRDRNAAASARRSGARRRYNGAPAHNGAWI